ncbi:MAG: hypothetical protein ABIP17_12215 [Ilumatobacteraceae bacterium]
MSVNTLTLVVVAANVLGAAMAVPQATKLIRERSPDGVSVTWAAISATVNGWWGVYALGVGDWSILPVSVVSVLAYLVITVAVVKFSTTPTWPLLRPAALATATIGLVPLLAVSLDDWVTAGIVLGALYGIQLSPAVVTVYRTIDVSGVSLATWVMAFAEALLWGIYGLANLDVGLIALASAGTFMSSLVLVRLFVRRPRHTYHDAGVPGFATV